MSAKSLNNGAKEGYQLNSDESRIERTFSESVHVSLSIKGRLGINTMTLLKCHKKRQNVPGLRLKQTEIHFFRDERITALQQSKGYITYYNTPDCPDAL